MLSVSDKMFVVHIRDEENSRQSDCLAVILTRRRGFDLADKFVFSEANYKRESEDEKPQQKSVGSFKNMVIGLSRLQKVAIERSNKQLKERSI